MKCFLGFLIFLCFVLFAANNCIAECVRIEFAELQSMSKDDLDVAIKDFDKESDYLFKTKMNYRMASKAYNDLSDKWEKCMQESIRVLKYRTKKYPPSNISTPNLTVQ